MESSPPSPSPSLRQPPTSIEDLPSGAIEDILNRMPLRDAVRTSVLSPDWRHRWKSIPDLDFGDDYNLPVSAINTVLNHHSSSPIRSFSLDNRNVTVSDTDRWILSLSRRRPDSLSSLTLRFPFKQRQPRHHVHSHLFSFRSLQSLVLNNCSISNSSSFFPLLRKLELQFVKFPDDQVIHRLISNSPNLTDLILSDVTPSPRNLVIANPNLSCFLLDAGEEECTSIIFAAGQALDKVAIFLTGDNDKFDLSQSFPNGASCNSTLQLGPFTVQGFAQRSIPEYILNGFQNLIALDIQVNFGKTEQILLLLCLMRSAPNLHKLDIRGLHRVPHGRLNLGKDFWKQHSMGLLDNIRMVELHFSPVLEEPEIGFLLCILERASRLEKLLLYNYTRSPPSDDSTVDMLRNYQRASPHAKIMYYAH